MYKHEIRNQHGNHIIDQCIIDEINDAIDKDLDHTYFEGSRIDIVEDFRTDDLRETVVNVEGI